MSFIPQLFRNFRLYCILSLVLLPLVACQPLQAPPDTSAVATAMAGAQIGADGETVAIQPPPATTVAQYGRLELQLSTNSSVKNPYDPAQLDLRVTFTMPSGEQLIVPAFWMQPYDLKTQQPTGEAGWHVRFTPSTAGSWQAQAMIGGSLARSELLAFDVTPAASPGFIRIDPDNPRYFAFDDGSFYLPVGLNIGWAGQDVLGDYERWLDRLSSNQGNVIRVWMASWSFGIEWADTGLGNYDARMKQAWLLDQIFAMAEERGIYVMLCLINHGAFSTSVNSEWAQNPYNDDLGGPLKSPAEFVTDPVAKAFFKQRLRYIAARWGYSTHLFAWEWWNEVNWTGIGDETLMPWIVEMTPVLQEFDPYDHLITNSSANGSFTQVWALPEIDFSQQHDYTGGDLLRTLARDFTRISKIAPDKPLLMGELGYSAGAQDALDALHLHMGLWGAPFLGYAGGSMYWWWDTFIDPQDQWHQYGALARFFAGEDLALLHTAKATVNDDRALALALQDDEHALLWLYSADYTVPAAQAAYDKALFAAIRSKEKLIDWYYEPPLVSGVTITLAGLTDGPYTVQWYAPATGDWLAEEPIIVQDGLVTLSVADFSTDMAAKVVRQSE